MSSWISGECGCRGVSVLSTGALHNQQVVSLAYTLSLVWLRLWLLARRGLRFGGRVVISSHPRA